MTPHRCEHGFTLIELLAAIVLLALLAAITVVSLRAAVSTGQLEDVLEQVQQYDMLMRERARRSGQALQLVVDVSGQQLRVVDPATGTVQGQPLQLPRRYRLAHLYLADDRMGHGQTALACSASGMTPSYGLRLSDHEDHKSQSRYLLVAGLTGFWVELDDERTLQSQLALVRGHDAR